MTAKVIAFCNRKGGVGKTSIATVIAYEFARFGKRTLLIDLDPQANSSAKYIDNYEDIEGITEVLIRQIDIKNSIRKTEAHKNLDIITSKIELDEVVEYMQMKSQIAILKRQIEDIKSDYDIIILDTNPSIPIMLRNCVYASDLIIIPANIDKNSIKGVDLTLKIIKETIMDSPIELGIDYRIAMSKVTFSAGEPTNIAKEVLKQVKDKYSHRLLESTIRLQSKPAQMQSFINSFFPTDDNSKYGNDYKELRKELESILWQE